MKNLFNFFRQNIEFLLSFLLFSIVVSLYYYSKIDNTLLLGLIGAIATLYLGMIKNKMENDKVFYDLFQSFNKRYDEKFNNLINELKNNQSRNLNPEEYSLIIDYLNLCAEEYLWRTKNRIPKKVWIAWRAGIIDNIRIKQVKDVYESETISNNGKKSFYGLVEELAKHI